MVSLRALLLTVVPVILILICKPNFTAAVDDGKACKSDEECSWLYSICHNKICLNCKGINALSTCEPKNDFRATITHIGVVVNVIIAILVVGGIVLCCFRCARCPVYKMRREKANNLGPNNAEPAPSANDQSAMFPAVPSPSGEPPSYAPNNAPDPEKTA